MIRTASAGDLDACEASSVSSHTCETKHASRCLSVYVCVCDREIPSRRSRLGREVEPTVYTSQKAYENMDLLICRIIVLTKPFKKLSNFDSDEIGREGPR